MRSTVTETRPERPSSDETVILAAAAVVAREKGISMEASSLLKNQVTRESFKALFISHGGCSMEAWHPN